MPDPLPLEVKQAREIARLKIANGDLRAVNKQLLCRDTASEEFLCGLKEVIDADKVFKYTTKPKYKLSDPADPSHHETGCVLISDIHLSEVIDWAATNQINKYNSVIAANRMYEYASKVKSIFARHMLMYKLDEIVVFLLGDIINGSIHPDLAYSNDLTDASAALLATRLLRMFMEELKTLGLPIRIHTAVGNHPRMTAKMPSKKQAQTNWDWSIYENLADKFVDDDQVTVIVGLSQIGFTQIYGHRYAYEHGIGTAHGSESKLEGKIRNMYDSKIYRQMTGIDGSSVDQVVIGDLHRESAQTGIIVNGALPGSGELGSLWHLSPIPSSQTIWGVSEKHKRTFLYQLEFTDILSEDKDNPMSEYASWFLERHGK